MSVEVHLRKYATHPTKLDISGRCYSRYQQTISPILHEIQKRRANSEEVYWYIRDCIDAQGRASLYPIVLFDDEEAAVWFRLTWG